MRDNSFNKVLLPLFLFLFLSGTAQKNQVKIVINASTGQPLDFVYITAVEKQINMFTNKEGKFILITDPAVTQYNFYKMGYYPEKKSLSDIAKNDTIKLIERIIGLDEVTVTSRIIDTVVKDKRFYVNDYLLLPNNDIVLLTSKINYKGFEIAYYKKDRGITCVKKIKNETDEHFKLDCFNNVQLLTNAYSRQLFFLNDSTFDFLDRNRRSLFDSSLALCALKLDTEVVFKSFLPPTKIKTSYFDSYANSPFLTYVSASKHLRKNLYTVVYNKQLKEMLDYEVADMAMIILNAKMFGIKAPSRQNIESQMNLFYTKVAKPIYAPIFLQRDSIVVFNFNQNIIAFIDNRGNVLREVKIDEKEFSQFRDFEVIHDPLKNRFYVRTKNFDNCTLSEISINTGKILKKIKLEKTFARNIQVLNGHIYYLVKEKEWDDTCYLYKQNSL